MAKEKLTDDSRTLIVALRDSGLSWREVATEAESKLGFTMSASAARSRYRSAKGIKADGRDHHAAGAVKRPSGRTAPSSRKAHSLDEFRAKFDVTMKIEDKVAELLAEGDHYYTDDDFRGLCGVSVQNWRRHAELDRFKRYQFRKPGFHAWAPAALVVEMQEITGAQGH